MRITALIVAAGRGSRAGGGIPKQYRRIGGEAVLTRSIRALFASELVSDALVCIHPDDQALYDAAAPDDARLLPPVHGGAERALSVRAGLEALAGDPPDLVLIHDAARPFVSPEIIAGVVSALDEAGGAMPALAVVDALRMGENGRCGAPVPREISGAPRPRRAFASPISSPPTAPARAMRRMTPA